MLPDGHVLNRRSIIGVFVNDGWGDGYRIAVAYGSGSVWKDGNFWVIHERSDFSEEEANKIKDEIDEELMKTEL